jgi:hypothetical protein
MVTMYTYRLKAQQLLLGTDVSEWIWFANCSIFGLAINVHLVVRVCGLPQLYRLIRPTAVSIYRIKC